MALSFNDILKDLTSGEETLQLQSAEESTKQASVEVPDIEKIAQYLDALAKPDSVIDELAKLAVLQDWVYANNIPMDKLAEVQFEIKDDEHVTMLKTASQVIRDLSTKVAELTSQQEVRTEAEKIAKKMCSAGHISQEDILDKVAELSVQPMIELITLEKALELSKTASMNLGVLSNSKDSPESPEEAFNDYILS